MKKKKTWYACSPLSEATIAEADAVLEEDADEDIRALARAQRDEARAAMDALIEDVQKRLVRSDDDAQSPRLVLCVCAPRRSASSIDHHWVWGPHSVA